MILARSLALASITFLTSSVMAPVHAAIIVKGSPDLPPLYLSDRSMILDDAGPSNNALPMETAISPELPIAAPEAVVPQFLSEIPPLAKPVGDSVKSSADTIETYPEALDEPQPGPEPYIMLLIGLGMIALALILHLKPIQHRRSGFEPSQGMPFV